MFVHLLSSRAVLALVGCVSVSPGIPSLYLFLLKVNQVTLRVGYFGNISYSHQIPGIEANIGSRLCR
jgi:hypothetical protein